jgi:hypothetical protein
VSNKAGFITGITIQVDGGPTAASQRTPTTSPPKPAPNQETIAKTNKGGAPAMTDLRELAEIEAVKDVMAK